jgi:hypothetical protein
MYQITDGTFAQAKRECRHEPSGPCWFDSLYTRVVPSQAIALTATLLDRAVAAALKRQRITTARLRHQQDLAAVVHLCGAGAGEAYARRAFRLTPGQRCGDHDLRAYLARVNGMKRLFAGLASEGRKDD